MKGFKKVFYIFIATLMLFTLSVTAFAGNETNDGNIKIQVATDKGSYGATGVAEITATITNVSGEDINNVTAQAVFDDLAPAGKRKSETSKSVDVLKSGESFSFTYKATLNKDEHKLNIFQKIILWFVRLFNGGYNANNNNIDVVTECVTGIDFGKFTAENVIQVGYEENKAETNDYTYEELIENVDIDEMYDYEDINRIVDEETGIEYLDNLIIIMFKDDCTDEEKAKIVNSVNGKVVGGDILYNELYIKVKNSTLNELEKLCEELENYRGVDLATPEEFIYTINSIPTDPWGNTLGKWNAEAFGINENNWWALATELRSAWEYDEYFSNINIGIADVGFDTSHEDYSTKFKLVSKENSSDNHGTHVTGIIGAQHNNEKGLSGVINKCSLVGYDLSKASGKFKSDTEALKALKVLVEDYKCKVVNFSIGTNIYVRDNGCYSDEKCKKAVSEKDVNDWGYKASRKIGKLFENGNDFIVVQSAGNGAKNTNLGIDAVNNGAFCSITKENCYSSNKISKEEIMDRVIIVANANKDKYSTDDYSLNDTSNGNNNYVDIAAPGTNIYSTVAGIEDKENSIKTNQKYGWLSGTSMAAPIVAGVAGLVWSVNKDFTGSMVKKIITSSAEQGGILVKDNPTSPTTGDFYLVNAKLAVEKAMMLTYDTCTIKGSFVDEDGNALSGVNIVATNKETGKKVCGLNNNDGTFSLLLPTGTYNIEFSKYDSKSIVDTEKLTKGQVLDLGEDWLFVGKSYVTGTVTDKSTGEPISGVTVNSMHNLYDSYNSTATTDENGCFRMEIQRGDNYYIGFEHNDYDYFGVEKDITLAETDLGNIELSKPALASGNCGADGDNVTWTLYEDGELVISGSGEMTHINWRSPWSSVQSKIKSLTIKSGVENIHYAAFENCENLSSVSISDTVTVIGMNAFKGTEYYNNSDNWEDGVLYIGNHLIEAKKTIERCQVKAETIAIAQTAFVSCKNLTDVIIGSNVRCIGPQAFAYCNNLKSVTIFSQTINVLNDAFQECPVEEVNIALSSLPATLHKDDTIKTVNILEGVTKIDESGYASLDVLENLTIPNTVTDIGYGAFKYSLKLDSIEIPDSVIRIDSYAFLNCYSLTDVIIGDGVEIIGEGAFSGCDKLSSISIPNYVKTIGDLAFYDCGNLENVILGENIETIGRCSFNGCKLSSVVIPNKETTIGDDAFSGNYSMTNLVLGEKIEKIGKNAFRGCKINKITIPDSVTEIGEGAFSHCYELEVLILGKNVESIGKSAFQQCYGIKNLTIPDSVKTIGEDAFYSCENVITVTIGKNVEFIGEHAFNSISQLEFIVVDENNKSYSSDKYGVLYNKSKTELIQYPIKSLNTAYYIPDSVLKISDSSFYNSDNLIKVIIGNGVTSIERNAFASCNNLQTLVLGNSVSSIGYYAFYDCYKLDSIVIPLSIREIESGAFYYCSNLGDVYYTGTEEEWNKINIGEYAFEEDSVIHYNA